MRIIVLARYGELIFLMIPVIITFVPFILYIPFIHPRHCYNVQHVQKSTQNVEKRRKSRNKSDSSQNPICSSQQVLKRSVVKFDILIVKIILASVGLQMVVNGNYEYRRTSTKPAAKNIVSLVIFFYSAHCSYVCFVYTSLLFYSPKSKSDEPRSALQAYMYRRYYVALINHYFNQEASGLHCTRSVVKPVSCTHVSV